MSIRLKLIIVFLAIALIPLLFVSVLTFHNYKNALETNRLTQLQNIASFKADKIETYFAGLKSNIEIAQGLYNIKKNLPVLTRLADNPDNPEFVTAKKMLDEQLQQMQSVLGLSDIMLLNPKGKVVYSSNSEHYPKDFSKPLFDPEQKAFEEGKNKIYFSDVFFSKALGDKTVMLVTAPAYDFNDAFIGVIALEVDATSIYSIIQDVTGLGETGEVLLGRKTGNQVLYLNPLRHDPNAALIRRIDIGGEVGRPIQEAVQGKTGTGQYLDYRGKKVIAAWRYIPSIDWGMVAKIDADEAFADVANLRNLAGIILAIVIVLSSITAFSIAQSISEPIKRLSEGARITGSGNLDYKIGTKSKDEIGQLSRTFDKMTSDLKQTTASRDELNKEIDERRQVEQALRESKKDLDRAQAVAHSGSWRLDVRQNKLTWSDEAYRIFGVPTGTPLKYETFLSFIHPDDREYVDAKWKTALNGEKYDIEHRIVVNGQTKWVRERAELEFEKDGSLLGGFGTVTDITQRKQMENELREARDELEMRVKERTADLDEMVTELQKQVEHRIAAEETVKAERKRFENVLEMLPAYAVLLTPDYHVAYANRTFREWFGDDNGQKCYEFLFNRTELSESRETYTVLKTGKSHFWEWTGPNGRNYDIYDYPFTDTDGSPLIMEIGVDVTAHKQAQKAVRQGEERYRSLTVATTQIVWTTDAQGQVVGDMPSWREFTGQSVDEIQGWGWINSLHPDDRDRTAEIWSRCVQNRSLYETEYRMLHRDGQYRYVSVRGVPVLQEDGGIREWIGTCTDITEKKAAEVELEKYRLHLEDLVKQRTEELARSNKDLEEFAYVASHDLQEPLRAVSGFVELLRRNLQSSLDDKTKEYMNFTIDGAKRMQSLINGLLEYSRVGTQGKNPKKTDSKAALDEAIARLQASIKETGAKITTDGLPTIHFDDVQLTQLLQNLIGNAIKFRSEQAPRIHINAVRKDNGWQFAVTDNGIGIEPQYTERIFQIFQRLHGRGKYPGTGIGLSICKKIVERHNGKIWVESKPGNSSTFYFTVPDLGEA